MESSKERKGKKGRIWIGTYRSNVQVSRSPQFVVRPSEVKLGVECDEHGPLSLEVNLPFFFIRREGGGGVGEGKREGGREGRGGKRGKGRG